MDIMVDRSRIFFRFSQFGSFKNHKNADGSAYASNYGGATSPFLETNGEFRGRQGRSEKAVLGRYTSVPPHDHSWTNLQEHWKPQRGLTLPRSPSVLIPCLGVPPRPHARIAGNPQELGTAALVVDP